eukprot:scaffold291273_cov22-Tisochrysis_lutea.AAC.1
MSPPHQVPHFIHRSCQHTTQAPLPKLPPLGNGPYASSRHPFSSSLPDASSLHLSTFADKYRRFIPPGGDSAANGATLVDRGEPAYALLFLLNLLGRQCTYNLHCSALQGIPFALAGSWTAKQATSHNSNSAAIRQGVRSLANTGCPLHQPGMCSKAVMLPCAVRLHLPTMYQQPVFTPSQNCAQPVEQMIFNILE